MNVKQWVEANVDNDNSCICELFEAIIEEYEDHLLKYKATLNQMVKDSNLDIQSIGRGIRNTKDKDKLNIVDPWNLIKTEKENIMKFKLNENDSDIEIIKEWLNCKLFGDMGISKYTTLESVNDNGIIYDGYMFDLNSTNLSYLIEDYINYYNKSLSNEDDCYHKDVTDWLKNNHYINKEFVYKETLKLTISQVIHYYIRCARKKIVSEQRVKDYIKKVHGNLDKEGTLNKPSTWTNVKKAEKIIKESKEKTELLNSIGVWLENKGYDNCSLSNNTIAKLILDFYDSEYIFTKVWLRHEGLRNEIIQICYETNQIPQPIRLSTIIYNCIKENQHLFKPQTLREQIKSLKFTSCTPYNPLGDHRYKSGWNEAIDQVIKLIEVSE